jgi:hypothetical protein
MDAWEQGKFTMLVQDYKNMALALLAKVRGNE